MGRLHVFFVVYVFILLWFYPLIAFLLFVCFTCMLYLFDMFFCAAFYA